MGGASETEVSTLAYCRPQTQKGKVPEDPWGLDAVKRGQRKWQKVPSAARCPRRCLYGRPPAWGCSCTTRSPGSDRHGGSELVRLVALAGCLSCIFISLWRKLKVFNMHGWVHETAQSPPEAELTCPVPRPFSDTVCLPGVTLPGENKDHRKNAPTTLFDIIPVVHTKKLWHLVLIYAINRSFWLSFLTTKIVSFVPKVPLKENLCLYFL